MKIYKSFYYFIILFSFSCRSQNNDTTKSQHKISIARAINNKALRISLNNRCNKDSIQKAINLLEKAIKLDNACYMCYSNQAQMFCDLKMYDKAINVLNRYLIHFPDKFNFEELKGFIFERMGNIDSANIIYNKAIEEYNTKIKLDSSNISLKINRAVLYFFTEGDDRAKREYEKIIAEYPNDPMVNNMREIFSSFDRKTYINNLFSDCN